MLLKIGSQGEDVKKLQSKLGLKADGDFGPVTESKVKEWQAANNLTSDGIVGDNTWEKLFSNNIQLYPISSFKLTNLKGHIPRFSNFS
jgi:peptidoglycan hydrolase-like protein with peptidoglycan-binding domain